MKDKGGNWNLEGILTIEDWEKELGKTGEWTGKIDRWWNKLGPTMVKGEFGEIMLQIEELQRWLARLGYLPHLMEAVNQKDRKAKLMRARLQEVEIVLAEGLRKIGLWLKGQEVGGKTKLDKERANKLFATITDLQHSLEYGFELGKYSLREREEEIVMKKDMTGQRVLSEIRQLIEAEMVYEVGKKKIRTQAELMVMIYEKNKVRRKTAYRALLSAYKKHVDKLFAIYQGVVNDWGYEAKIRGYSSPIEVRNVANEIPDKVVDELLETVEEKRAVFGKYFGLKAKSLGQRKLSRYDLYATMGKNGGRKYGFEEAKEIVLTTFDEVMPVFGEMARKIIEGGHLDVYPRKNKQNGAFCATVEPKTDPYILLNFTGKWRDVTTLAHELGHGVHSMLANHHLPSVQQAGLPLAETASTLAETMVFERMYQQSDDVEEKKAMLWEKISDTYATVLRQAYFVKFEKEAHGKMAGGMAVEELSKLWLTGLKEQMGKWVKIEPVFGLEWAYVSHIFEAPFYCYAYSFGELLTLALYRRLQISPEKTKGAIERILAAGGAEAPIEILKKEGIDVTNNKVWEEGFEVIEGWINELERN